MSCHSIHTISFVRGCIGYQVRTWQLNAEHCQVPYGDIPRLLLELSPVVARQQHAYARYLSVGLVGCWTMEDRILIFGIYLFLEVLPPSLQRSFFWTGPALQHYLGPTPERF